MNLTTLFDEAIDRKASDIHLATDETPRLRIARELVAMEAPPLTGDSLDRLLEPLMTPEARMRLESGLPREKTLLHRNILFSGTVFRSSEDTLIATFRLLSNEVPDIEKIGEGALPFFESLQNSRRGLAVISGRAGSGKTTTLCAVVEAINAARADRIFTISSQPFYRFASKRGMVTEIHCGQDQQNYERALQVCYHSDLDCIAIDDIPTVETLRQLLLLAETGHLVFANLHADSVLDALQRLLDTSDRNDDALRKSLSQNLIAVSAQRLFVRKSGPGRVPAYEWLKFGDAARSALVRGEMRKLEGLMTSNPDCRSMQASLNLLVESGQISEEQARD